MTFTLVFEDQVIAPDIVADRVLRSATVLRGLGIGAGDVVALMLRNHPGTVELMLAARWIGATWCPVNWHFKADEVRHLLADCGARLLVVDADLLATLGEVAPAGTTVIASRGDGWDALRDAAAPLHEPAQPPRGPMLYTSGTTGRPKGIVRDAPTPAQVAATQAKMRRVAGAEPGMRALVSAPLYHSAPNGFVVAVAGQEDATLVLARRFDAEETLRLIERRRLTHAYLVPTMYVRLLRLPDDVKRRHDLGSMRFVSSTGSPCPGEVKRAMIDWWGPVIHEAYGSSELGYMTLLDSRDALRKPGSAGRPLDGVSIRILDDAGRALPRGTPGRIFVRPDAFVDFSYAHNDAARRAMEVDGHLTMGDVGYLDDDGFLFIVDRAADMVISGGVNIYPAEIEARLQTMPGVADCAVFGIPDAEFGEGLAAAVQCVPGTVLAAADVTTWLKQRIAGYKVPQVVTFHAELPREDTGKIFKRRLREPYWAGQARRI
jgi:long-chain acyl-CoA synthetase